MDNRTFSIDPETKELIIENDRLRAIFEDIFVPLILVSDQLLIKRANRAAVRFIGGTSGSVELLLPEIFNQLKIFHEDKDQIEGKIEVTIRNRTMIVQMTKVSKTDMLIILQDVSKEQFLAAQLRQAQKMESVGQLTSGIAHDFSNILTVIGGYANIIKRGLAENDTMRDHLQQINNSVDKGVSMIRNLLSFTRCSPTNHVLTNINDIVVNVMKMAERLLNVNVIVDMELCAKKLTVVADEVQMEHCVLNLITNAQDAMPNGGSLNIKTFYLDEKDVSKIDSFMPVAKEYAKIVVSDTGTGMDQTTINNIFNPFFTTKGPQKGTGLGLAMVSDIVKHHKGKIDCESKIGEGTTFSIYIPLADQ